MASKTSESAESALATTADDVKPPKFLYPTAFYVKNGMFPICPTCGERERTSRTGKLCPVNPQPSKCWLKAGGPKLLTSEADVPLDFFT